MIINHLQIISPCFTCGIGEKNSPCKSNDLQGEKMILYITRFCRGYACEQNFGAYYRSLTRRTA